MAIYLDTYRKEADHTFMKMEDHGEYVGDVRVDHAANVAREILHHNASDHEVAGPDQIVLDFDLVNRIHAMLAAASLLSKDKTIAGMARDLHESVGKRATRIAAHEEESKG